MFAHDGIRRAYGEADEDVNVIVTFEVGAFSITAAEENFGERNCLVKVANEALNNRVCLDAGTQLCALCVQDTAEWCCSRL